MYHSLSEIFEKKRLEFDNLMIAGFELDFVYFTIKYNFIYINNYLCFKKLSFKRYKHFFVYPV